MHITLTLFPILLPHQIHVLKLGEGSFLVTDQICLQEDNDWAIYNQLRDMYQYGAANHSSPVVTPQRVPDLIKISYNTEDGMVDLTEPEDSTPLSYILASDFNKIYIPEETSPINKAILAFMKALPGDTWVLLHFG